MKTHCTVKQLIEDLQKLSQDEIVTITVWQANKPYPQIALPITQMFGAFANKSNGYGAEIRIDLPFNDKKDGTIVLMKKK